MRPGYSSCVLSPAAGQVQGSGAGNSVHPLPSSPSDGTLSSPCPGVGQEIDLQVDALPRAELQARLQAWPLSMPLHPQRCR